MPNISIIVPIYNVEVYLRPCVDSILAQTFTDFELILVDDGSPDNCGAICDEYAVKDSRIHVIHQENGGLSAARNTGIETAKGMYLTFIDSDDLVHPHMLEKMKSELENRDADVCICDLQRFSEMNQINPKAGAGMPTQTLTNLDACESLYSDQSAQYTVACAKLYRRELFHSVRFPVHKYHEDEATTYKILYSAKRIVVIPNAYYYYRINSSGIMLTESVERRKDALEAFQSRLKFFQDHCEDSLAEKTSVICNCMKAKLNIVAEKNGCRTSIPAENRMSIIKALLILRKHDTESKYLYFLAMVQPKLLLPYAYWKKIKSILGFQTK